MTMRRGWVRIWKWSRAFLSTWGLVRTVINLRWVGRGTGPTTLAPEVRAVSTIFWIASSMTRWSKDLSFKRILPASMGVFYHAWRLLQNFGDGAGADGVAAFANGKAEALLQGHGGD